MHGDFSRLCAEDKALDADKVADVQEFLENDVVKVFIFVGAKVVARNVHLNPALRVLQFGKTGLSHHATAHHAARDAHLGEFYIVVINIPLTAFNFLADFGGKGVGGKFGGGIGIDAHLAQFLKTLSANNLLFAEFEYIHKILYKMLVRGCKVSVKKRLFCQIAHLFSFFAISSCQNPSRRKSSASRISASVAVWSRRMSPMSARSVKLMMPATFFLSCCIRWSSSG